MGSIQIKMRHKRNPNPNPKDVGDLPRHRTGSAESLEVLALREEVTE
jgi:hypothetical protein